MPPVPVKGSNYWTSLMGLDRKKKGAAPERAAPYSLPYYEERIAKNRFEARSRQSPMLTHQRSPSFGPGWRRGLLPSIERS